MSDKLQRTIVSLGVDLPSHNIRCRALLVRRACEERAGHRAMSTRAGRARA